MNSANGYSTISIGDLGRVVTGKTPPTKNPDFFGDEYPFITPTDMKDGQRHIKTERYLSEQGRGTMKNALLPAGSVCFVCIGATIGKVCMADKPSFTNQQINSIIVDPERHDPRFIYYLMTTLPDSIKSMAGGAATPIVNKTSFSNVKIQVPPFEVQKRVGDILGSYDDLIENNLRRIQILEEIAQNLYREWFVKLRFPGHEHVKMIDSPAGKIPVGWKITILANVCSIVMGQSPKSEFYNDSGDGLPFHQGVTNYGHRYPVHTTYCTCTSRMAEDGDILFSVRAPVGRINIADTRIVIGRGLSAIRNRSNYQWFTYHQLKERFQEEDTIGGGTIYKAVTKHDMETIPFIVPDESIVGRYEVIASEMSNLIYNATLRNRILIQQRNILLDNLMRGRGGS